MIIYTMKPQYFEGSSLADLRELPREARQAIGFQLERVQSGKDPKNWKPLTGLGKGVSGIREIRVEIDTNIFRSAYVAKLGDAIVVLHCWNKKTNATAGADKKIIVERYKAAQEKFV